MKEELDEIEQTLFNLILQIRLLKGRLLPNPAFVEKSTPVNRKRLKRAKPIHRRSNLVVMLQAYKEENRISENALAKKLGVSNSSISGWFRNKWKPTPESAERIKQFLDLK